MRYFSAAMANVFLSYAREDGAKAAPIAHALTAQGWKVRGTDNSPGRTFDDVIEDALDDAGCVVVLWSQAAIASHWVRRGRRRHAPRHSRPQASRRCEDSARVQAHPGREPQIGGVSSDDPKFEQFLQSISMLMQPTTIAPVGGKVRHQNPEPVSIRSSARLYSTRRQPYRRAGISRRGQSRSRSLWRRRRPWRHGDHDRLAPMLLTARRNDKKRRRPVHRTEPAGGASRCASSRRGASHTHDVNAAAASPPVAKPSLFARRRNQRSKHACRKIQKCLH